MPGTLASDPREYPFMSTRTAHRPLSRRHCLLSTLLVLGAGSLAASQSHAAAKGTWSEGVSRDQTFSRVLIVGVGPDLNQRCNFERTLAASIKSEDTEAFIACDVLAIVRSVCAVPVSQ